MSNLLEGKLAIILGIANKWSLAYAIAQAFSREGATLALTYLGEHQKDAIEDLSKDLNVAAILHCDVTKDEELVALTESLRALDRPLDAVMHSLAFANREDLVRPFVETTATLRCDKAHRLGWLAAGYWRWRLQLVSDVLFTRRYCH